MNWFWPAYIDPGMGAQIVSSTGPFWAVLLVVLGALLWPFKKLWQGSCRFLGKGLTIVLFSILMVGIGCGIFYFYFGQSNLTEGEGALKKVIVLGMDGLDPDVMEKMMEKGELQNFENLRRQGGYSRFQTVYPPQSPVAWSTMATGLNPGGHRLFDFLWRHKEHYLPDLALAEPKKEKVKILGIETPMEKIRFVSRRQGVPFWKRTSDAGIRTTVIHWPVTFPAEKVSHAMLSGMGVPDIRGTQGTFSYYSSKEQGASNVQGGFRVSVNLEGNRIKTFLRGPVEKARKSVEVPLSIQVDRKASRAILSWQDQELTLRQNQWSPWVRVKFPMPGEDVVAMTRFYLRSVEPEFELYVSPFNFAPEKPAQPISYPGGYAKELKKEIGDFHTLGMPLDTWALNDGAMNEEMFLEEAYTVLDEEKEILKYELARFHKGLFVFAIEMSDSLQHMFWRAIDPKSPLYSKEIAQKYGNVIPDMYRRMDEVLGFVMGYVDEDTTIVVMSDHGFAPFRRAVHLNSWLRDNGYLVYWKGRGENKFFEGVDWSKSRAYALGIGGIYLNLKGREGMGIVEPGEEAEKIKSEIVEKLKELKDEDGSSVVHNVFKRQQIFRGPYTDEAPDLLVGFNRGYRASWQTALGGAPEHLVEDNLKKWSGDHIMDPVLVPGIVFSNHRIVKEQPSLYDLAPTVLSLFGLDVSEGMEGHSIFKRD